MVITDRKATLRGILPARAQDCYLLSLISRGLSSREWRSNSLSLGWNRILEPRARDQLASDCRRLDLGHDAFQMLKSFPDGK
jgi:hypothetical protein